MSSLRKSISGLAVFSLAGSLFSTGLLLWFGYASQLVYTIGDTRQLGPLFLGIIAGSMLFSLVGYLTRPTLSALVLEALAASLLLAVSYSAMVLDSFVLGGTMVLAVSFAMSSALAPVGTLLRLGRGPHSLPMRATFGTVQGLLTILFVFLYAYHYEANGQLDFYVGPLVLLALSLLSSMVLMRVR
ncbi:MAG: hypothetical protein JRN38_04280 [Nitrososphaerota archaeon]|nr:hypothetical protein [Nitrososphaerota archaeon]